MKVSKVAQILCVSPDTIRYYTRIGMLKPVKDANGYHIYSEKELARLRFILRAKQLGFSLADIQALIDTADRGETPCPIAREIISKNIQTLEHSIKESLALFKQMKIAVSEWEKLPDKYPDHETICALIESWDKELEQ